jgi:hypothetical protein
MRSLRLTIGTAALLASIGAPASAFASATPSLTFDLSAYTDGTIINAASDGVSPFVVVVSQSACLQRGDSGSGANPKSLHDCMVVAYLAVNNAWASEHYKHAGVSVLQAMGVTAPSAADIAAARRAIVEAGLKSDDSDWS